MIIVKLMGGLGNQMFQYALGRRLANLHNTELRLDHRFLESRKNITTPRDYELHYFNISGKRASQENIASIALHDVGLVKRFRLKLRPLDYQLSKSERLIRERSFRFDSSILELPDNVYLDGFWQTDLYFTEVADMIRQDFTFCVPMSTDNLVIAEKIKSCMAVSLHVRRGDYVSDEQTAEFHGSCKLEYYSNAVELLADKVDSPHFFIFSDDTSWVKQNLKLSFPMTFVESNFPDRGFEDLRLMSLCRHHIIANSSFSWWGAWLNPDPEKFVIAPQRWFNAPEMDTTDLIPSGWVRI